MVTTAMTAPDGPASGTMTRREGRATSQEEVSAPTLSTTAHRQEEKAYGYCERKAQVRCSPNDIPAYKRQIWPSDYSDATEPILSKYEKGIRGKGGES